MRIEIEKLNNKKVSTLLLNKIAEMEEVKEVENNGYSGIYPNYIWYSVYLVNDSEIQVYCK